MAEGQIIRVSGWIELGSWPPRTTRAESGTGTVYYTDGTTPTSRSTWATSGTRRAQRNPINDQVASVNHANYPTGSSGHTVYVFEQSVPIDSGKTVEAVALPPLGRRRLQPGAPRVRARRELIGRRSGTVGAPVRLGR